MNNSSGVVIVKYFGEAHIYVLLISKCEWYVKYSWIDLW